MVDTRTRPLRGVCVRALDDLLTWQAIRQIADYEVLMPVLTPTKTLITSMIPERPQITWPHQYHWFAKAEPKDPEAGAILYARAAWGGRWRPDLLRRIHQPVVLLSTFYDLPIKDRETRAMFGPGSPVSRWFAVQTQTTHPQLTAMPLGVKHRMKPVLEAATPSATKDILLYCNFNYLRIGKQPDPVRKGIWEHFSSLPWVTTRTNLTTAEYVSDLGRSKFVLSPPGLGYDCYRTYEAIAMGAIPIVKRQTPVTDVCERLPVILVDEWSDVTEQRLKNASTAFYGKNERSTETMTLTYWRQQIQHAAAECREGVLA